MKGIRYSICFRVLLLFIASFLLVGTASPCGHDLMPTEKKPPRQPECTPIGGVAAGNEDGSIPRWTGGITRFPKTYELGGKLIDPFLSEKPLFTITSRNYQKHAALLSEGQIAMFQRYPSSFRMPIYPTHRTAIYPDEIYETIKSNTAKPRLAEDKRGVINPGGTTVPFPDPESALEIYWNHVFRYRGHGTGSRTYVLAVVQTNGSFQPVMFREQISWARDIPDSDNPNLLFALKKIIQAPARLEGEALLVHEYADQNKGPRNAWIYNPDQRRVRRATEVAYDGPGFAADNLRTADDMDMMNGAPDFYEWKLVGKTEMYIPYNAYKLLDGKLKYRDILAPGHLNPEYLRYEKHRVWVLDATLKEGKRHIYSRRTMYFDEDTWQIAMVDVYDGRGDLWRYHEGHTMVHYQVKVPWYAVESQFDLIAGRYIAVGLTNELSGYQYQFNLKESSIRDYTPAALRRAGQ